MKAKTSKTILLGLIGISFVLLASLGAVVHAAPRVPNIFKIDEIHFPDPTFRQYILDTIDEDKNGTLDVMEQEQVNVIDLSGGYNGNKIYDLTGIEYFTMLETIICNNNQLTTLDVSKNTELRTLWCSGNQLTDLDVNQNTLLAELNCSGNQLTDLDVSQSIELEDLNCSDNQLTSLDLSNNPMLLRFSGSEQTVDLGQIPKNEYDLLQKDPNIVGDKITTPTGATFNGTVMSNYKENIPVKYQYDVGSYNGDMLEVTLTFTFSIVNSNISYKDGNTDFTSWKVGYTAPSTYEEGTGVALPTADNVEKEGYIFAGWYDNENFTGNPITEIDAAATGDKILYAKWVSETFSVTIPKRITLSGETKSGAYSIGCTGNIKDYRYISVVPDSSFTMTQKGKDNVTGTMVQQITKFRSANYTGSLEADETKIGTNIRGTIHTPDLTAGSWNGALNFKITLS